MAEKRNWLINVVLILAVLAFVGFSTIPFLIDAVNNSQAKTTASSSPVPSPSASSAPKKEELEAQVKGYELVLQREPDNLTALRGLLEARLALGDIKGATEPLEKLAKLNPNETYYAVLLAQAKQQLQDPEGAAQVYRNILATKKGDLNALVGLVGLLQKQNRPEAAIGLLQDTLKDAPQANQIQAGSIDIPSVQVILGGVYADQKRYSEAIAIYDEAAKLDKQDFRPVLGKALALKAQGKPEEAKLLFNTAAELAPARYKDQIKLLAGDAPVPPNAAPGNVPAGSAPTGAPPTVGPPGTLPPDNPVPAPPAPPEGANPAPTPSSTPE
ncbi:tetratricopeptide repeat protein [Pantanalinema sp. GBBB05]|uniref:tetratricopeptide repeat protein n=1 Tax=Pantanalinema sp. GBBB05 TaxID=2604139 RepID=UPI001DFF9D20|nr:tetratricopeptide repeat protein [Pantanalinema sp. GBBB05]